MCSDFIEITDDADGHRTVTFQEAVAAIGRIVAPGRRDDLEVLAETSPNEVRRIFDTLLTHHPVAPEDEEKVLRIAWAYGELRFIRSLGRQISSVTRGKAEEWAKTRLDRRVERRKRDREAGAPFDSRAQCLGGDVPDEDVRIVHAAIRLFDGTVLGGPEDGTHPDVVESLDPVTRARTADRIESEGFVDSYGNYLDRGQASIVTGVPGESSEVAGTLQGTPLRKVQEESLKKGPSSTDAIALDDEEAADALDFLEQFRVDRAL
ncbi:MAG: hypothetical protein R6T96_03320 [Longimicrobiales bacterium]